MAFALSVLDFSSPLSGRAQWEEACPPVCREVVMGWADGKENLGEGAHVGCGTPSVLVGRDGFGAARELVFLNHSISENFREIFGDSGRALFVRIHRRCDAHCARCEYEQTESYEHAFDGRIFLGASPF
jgi:hypothetical protein